MKIKVNSKIDLTIADWFKTASDVERRGLDFKQGTIVDYMKSLNNVYINRLTKNNKIIERKNKSIKKRQERRRQQSAAHPKNSKHIKKLKQYKDAAQYFNHINFIPDRELIIRFGDSTFSDDIKQLNIESPKLLRLAFLVGLDNYIRHFNERNPQFIATEYVMNFDDNDVPYLVARIIPKNIDTNRSPNIHPLHHPLKKQFKTKDAAKGMQAFVEQERISVFEYVNQFFNQNVPIPEKDIFIPSK